MLTIHIKTAYGLGLLVGDTNGAYNPKNPTTRAETCVIINRLFEYSARADLKDTPPPVVPPVEEVVPPVVENGENIGKYGEVYPVEGNGITRDAASGVLGFGNGQKGGIYLGIQINNADGSKGETIKVGSYAYDTYDHMTMGDQYTTKHGFTFWSSEWDLIDKVARKNLPTASTTAVGTKADINGNVIKSGDTTTPAFWEVIEDYDYTTWLPAK